MNTRNMPCEDEQGGDQPWGRLLAQAAHRIGRSSRAGGLGSGRAAWMSRTTSTSPGQPRCAEDHAALDLFAVDRVGAGRLEDFGDGPAGWCPRPNSRVSRDRCRVRR